MDRTRIGTVKALRRYPVKSMLGEELTELPVEVGGSLGDRAWALREVVSGRILSAKQWPRLFEFRAVYETAPAPGRLAPCRITLPDGKVIHAADPDASKAIGDALGRKVRIERARPDEAARASIDPKTVFGDVAVETIYPGLTTDTLPDSFGLAKGTFFDSAPLHVLATATLAHMSRLAGGDSNFDPRRFRANILIDTADTAPDFVEDGWSGGVLEVGESMRVTAMVPALRCVMTTHPQENLPRDYAILRTAARHHRVNVGVFAQIGAPGIVRIGDPVFLAR